LEYEKRALELKKVEDKLLMEAENNLKEDKLMTEGVYSMPNMIKL
jgi:hypothetical protein